MKVNHLRIRLVVIFYIICLKIKVRKVVLLPSYIIK